MFFENQKYQGWSASVSPNDTLEGGRAGGLKYAKKCYVLFEWPLRGSSLTVSCKIGSRKKINPQLHINGISDKKTK